MLNKPQVSKPKQQRVETRLFLLIFFKGQRNEVYYYLQEFVKMYHYFQTLNDIFQPKL